MSGKFTPGPWHIKPGNTPGFKTLSGGAGIYAPARDTDNYFILQIAVMETNLKGQEVEANARLIASAPAMHAALEETWRVLRAAGLSNLARGVELGQMSWYVKICNAESMSDAALALSHPLEEKS